MAIEYREYASFIWIFRWSGKGGGLYIASQRGWKQKPGAFLELLFPSQNGVIFFA